MLPRGALSPFMSMVLAEGIGNGLLLLMVIVCVGMSIAQGRRASQAPSSLEQTFARNAVRLFRIFALAGFVLWLFLNGVLYRVFHELTFLGRTVDAQIVDIRIGDEKVTLGRRMPRRVIQVPVVEALWDGKHPLRSQISVDDLRKLEEGTTSSLKFVVRPNKPEVHLLGDKPTVRLVTAVGGTILVAILGFFFAVGVWSNRRRQRAT